MNVGLIPKYIFFPPSHFASILNYPQLHLASLNCTYFPAVYYLHEGVF